MGKSYIFPDTISHHLSYEYIRRRCVRGKDFFWYLSLKCSIFPFSFLYFSDFHCQNGNVGVLVPDCPVTMRRKLREYAMYGQEVTQWPSVLTLLPSTKANKRMSKAVSIRRWQCGAAISSSCKFQHELQCQLFSCCPPFYFLSGLDKCLKNIPSCPFKASNVFSLMQAKFSCQINKPRQRDKPHEQELGWFLSH